MKSRRASWPLLIAFSLMLVATSSGQVVPDDEGLTIAFTKGLFSDVGSNDATAATKIWASELKKKKGFGGPADAVAFDNLESLRRSWDRKEIDLVVLLTSEYFHLSKQIQLKPHFVPFRAGTAAEESLLLVHRESGIETMTDLAGGDILILTDSRGRLGTMWLELQVMAEQVDDLKTFFRSVRNTSKSSQTVLPVFFGQADACLVPSTGFELMCELNPQLKRDLFILKSSPAMVPSVLCIRSDYRSDLKEALEEALLDLHEEPRGQQILMLFKIDRLIPFQETFLGSAQALFQEYNRRLSLAKKLASAR